MYNNVRDNVHANASETTARSRYAHFRIDTK